MSIIRIHKVGNRLNGVDNIINLKYEKCLLNENILECIDWNCMYPRKYQKYIFLHLRKMKNDLDNQSKKSTHLLMKKEKKSVWAQSSPEQHSMLKSSGIKLLIPARKETVNRILYYVKYHSSLNGTIKQFWNCKNSVIFCPYVFSHDSLFFCKRSFSEHWIYVTMQQIWYK